MSDTTTVDPVTRKPRPLSPHLSVYRPIPTMVMSIAHRITGVGLYFGTLLVAWWLLSAASGPEAFETARDFFGSWFGRLVLFGYTFVLIQHALGGIKHLVQDTGRALAPDLTTKMAIAQPVLAIIVTLLIWFAAYAIRLG